MEVAGARMGGLIGLGRARDTRKGEKEMADGVGKVRTLSLDQLGRKNEGACEVGGWILYA